MVEAFSYQNLRKTLALVIYVVLSSFLLQASRLQTTMMETLEAVDFEKRKHNNTRKEAFGRLAKLEVILSFSLFASHL